MALVTLEMAKRRLRVVNSEEDDDILAMIDQASDLVVKRVDDTDVTDEWDEDTAPQGAQAATLELVLYLHERDTSINQRPDERRRLPPRVEMMLGSLIRPAIA